MRPPTRHFLKQTFRGLTPTVSFRQSPQRKRIPLYEQIWIRTNKSEKVDSLLVQGNLQLKTWDDRYLPFFFDFPCDLIISTVPITPAKPAKITSGRSVTHSRPFNPPLPAETRAVLGNSTSACQSKVTRRGKNPCQTQPSRLKT